jgi:hypothetical protein
MHMIPISKRTPTARTLPPTISNEFVDARRAEDVAAKLDRRVADVGRADWADGDFL